MAVMITRPSPRRVLTRNTTMDAVTRSSDMPTVFLVDDDEEVRESLELLLLAEGIQVRSYDSAEAFAQHEHLGSFGCLVLDVRLGGMNGLDLLERLARERSPLGVIIISASAVPHDKTRALQFGALEFIRKPYEIQRLLEAIRKVLSQTPSSFKIETP